MFGFGKKTSNFYELLPLSLISVLILLLVYIFSSSDFLYAHIKNNTSIIDPISTNMRKLGSSLMVPLEANDIWGEQPNRIIVKRALTFSWLIISFTLISSKMVYLKL